MDVDRSTLIKNNDENKTYILVKLSESFSNAIQEYHINQHSLPSPSPTIKFHGTRGAIKFPNGKSYDFSLAPSDNTVECIRQCNTRWESVAKVACCLHVKGKDDVYQRTRSKMEAAEQAKRKNRTKLLDVDSDGNVTATTAIAANPIAPTVTPSIARIISTATTTTTTTTSTATATPSNSNSHVNHNNSITTTNHNNSNNVTNNNVTSNSIIFNSGINNNNNNSSSSSANNSNNIVSKYPPITDIQQLKRYKADFDNDFREYQKLHDYLHEIENRFKALRELLKKSIEGSSEWESAKDKIFSEYEKHKGDSNFHRARNRYKQLHRKLAHIKKMIFQFKSKRKANNINSNGKHNDNNGKKKKNSKFKK